VQYPTKDYYDTIAELFPSQHSGCEPFYRHTFEGEDGVLREHKRISLGFGFFMPEDVIVTHGIYWFSEPSVAQVLGLASVMHKFIIKLMREYAIVGFRLNKTNTYVKTVDTKFDRLQEDYNKLKKDYDQLNAEHRQLRE